MSLWWTTVINTLCRCRQARADTKPVRIFCIAHLQKFMRIFICMPNFLRHLRTKMLWCTFLTTASAWRDRNLLLRWMPRNLKLLIISTPALMMMAGCVHTLTILGQQATLWSCWRSGLGGCHCTMAVGTWSLSCYLIDGYHQINWSLTVFSPSLALFHSNFRHHSGINGIFFFWSSLLL